MENWATKKGTYTYVNNNTQYRRVAACNFSSFLLITITASSVDGLADEVEMDAVVVAAAASDADNVDVITTDRRYDRSLCAQKFKQ